MGAILIALALILIIVSSGCSQTGGDGGFNGTNAQRTFDEIERNLDVFIADGMEIGRDHYQSLLDEITRLELEGMNVQSLLSKLERIMPEENASHDGNQQDNSTQDPINVPETGCDFPVRFTNPPFDTGGVDYIAPMGRVHGDHPAPTDHIYILSKEGADVEVYSPMDGNVKGIQHMGSFRADRFVMDDYHITIDHGCGIESIFIHVDTLSDRLAEVAPPDGEYASVDVDVDAGELLGTYSGSLDYSVVDQSVFINIINPESYGNTYEHRVHITNPFSYFHEPIRSELESYSLRSAEPLGGTIDYDVNGTLSGVWFLEGSGGWEGSTDPNTKYWNGHLAIVHDYVDTDQVMVSLGAYPTPEDESRQFAVRGSGHDPEDVTTGTGLVKYELADYEYADDVVLLDAEPFGVALFELVDDMTMKVEIFPGKSPSEVSGFTDDALTYVR